MEREIAIQITGLKKMYKLGQIGGGTLQGDLQSWWAKVRGREDPNTKIGTDTRSNGKTFMALNGVDLTVYKGEALGIIGHNGAGKSTMLKLLSRVTAPTEGEICFNGRIASMLEVGTGFNGEMTGRENIYMNGAILGMTRAEVDSKIEQIIDFSEVREFIDTPVKRYSSGMYVKLAFSVAAHLDSEIIIMDEVLAVGDMAFQKKCLEKMREAATRDGRTVLYVSHNMNTIRQLCDRCVVLDKGRVCFEGDVEQAINVYMGEAEHTESNYTFTGEHRSDKRSNDRFVFQGLELVPKESNFYQCGDTVEMDLRFVTNQDMQAVRLRYEVVYNDGTLAGTALSDGVFSARAGVPRTVHVSMNTAGLMDGRYRIDIVAYQMNPYGAEEFLDGVYPGFTLDLQAVPKETAELIWLHQWFGHVRLPDIQVR